MDDHKIKENAEQVTKKCVCSALHGLFIPNRQLSVAVSACIAMLFFSFMSGYFFGGQHAAQEFMYHVDHTSFNDQMSASLCALTKECTVAQVSDNDDSMCQDGDDNEFQECVRTQEAKESFAQIPDTQKTEKHYYAQLVGFGTPQAAQRFAKKLEKKQIPVEINKHSSRTAQGKTIHWYQVVTLPYADKQQLVNLVDVIQKTEKIQGTRIVAC